MKLKFAVLCSLLFAPLLAFTQPARHVLATTPTERTGRAWRALHAKFNEISRESKPQLVFVGDSITQFWGSTGKEVWDKYWAPLNAANFGISDDRTEHVLWRVENGNFAGSSPKLIVLMIGTNNTGQQGMDFYYSPPDQTAEGIKAIITKLQQITPESKILLLGIFPRGINANARWRKQNIATNAIIKDFADNQKVFYTDIGDKFLNPDGTLSADIMPDRLHLSPKGYAIWAEAIDTQVKELMK